MDNASYIVLSRQNALFREMSVVANNIANVDTGGFKADKMIFNKFDVKSGNPEKPAHKLTFTNDAQTFTDFQPGIVEQTGRQLDVAIKGDGFFMVRTPLGERYTRSGNFQINSEGTLVNAQGFPVLGQDRQEIGFQEEDVEFIIKEDGTISVGPDDRGQIGVVRFDRRELLEKQPNNLYKTDQQPVPATEEDNVVAQGLLEKSNVSAINELTDMIEVSRGVGTTSRFLNDIHDLQRKAISTINKQG